MFSGGKDQAESLFLEIDLTNCHLLMTNDAMSVILIPYLCKMKYFYFKSYNQIFVLFWIIIFILLCLQCMNQASFAEAILFSLTYSFSAFILAYFLTATFLERAMEEKRMTVFVGQFIFFSLLTSLILTFVAYGFKYLEEIDVFAPSLLFREKESFLISFIIQIPGALIINLGFCGLRFYYEHTKLQKVHLEVQLQMLREQMNPHFMFNVLNHIHILMQKDVDLASSLLIKYSDILRYQLYSGKQEYISLEQEIQFLKDFIDVEKIRWGNELEVNCSWKIEDRSRNFQPLLFITFIENAFKHVVRSTTEKGYIHIKLEQKGDTICLDIENSKSTLQIKKNTDSGLGLENIKKRLDILYPDKYKLLIEETETVYFSKLIITI